MSFLTRSLSGQQLVEALQGAEATESHVAPVDRADSKSVTDILASAVSMS